MQVQFKTRTRIETVSITGPSAERKKHQQQHHLWSIGTMQFDPVKVQYLIYYMTNEDTM